MFPARLSIFVMIVGYATFINLHPGSGQIKLPNMTYYKIGAIFERSQTDLIAYFRAAIQQTNRMLEEEFQKQHFYRRRQSFQLEAVVATIPTDDSFEAYLQACNLIQQGVITICGPIGMNGMTSVQGLANRYHIPHLQFDWGYQQSGGDNDGSMAFNIHPHYKAFGKAVGQFMDSQNHWNNIALIYSNELSLMKYEDMLFEGNRPVAVRRWRDDAKTHEYLIKQFKTQNEHFQYIVDIPASEVPEFLTLIKAYNMSEYYTYLFTDWDVDLSDSFNIFHHDQINVTQLKLVPVDIDMDVKHEAYNKENYQARLLSVKQMQKEIRTFWRDVNGTRSSVMKAALIFDGIKLLARGLAQSLNSAEVIPPTDLTCASVREWNPGLSLINSIRATPRDTHDYITGPIEFDECGWRSNFSLQLFNLEGGEILQYATWNAGLGLTITKDFDRSQQISELQLQGKTLRVGTVEEKPYVFHKNQANKSFSQDPNTWEGYCIDLLNELSERLGFNYTIHTSETEKYGTKEIKDGVPSWSGLVQKLLEKKVDLVVGSFTISHERAEYIDFTTPFMHLGISIIYKKPIGESNRLFELLVPLSYPVWGYILATTIIVSFVLFVVGRFSPYEWRAKQPCNVNSEVIENSFNVLNSMWFTFGSLMQKGSDILPHAVSTRLIAVFWWFFTLIIISSYTANLAAYLTLARLDLPISNADDLAKQTKIKYGHLEGGSTAMFFDKSQIATYQKMHSFMESQPNLLMNKTEFGIKRVQSEDYAFILESTMNEYYTAQMCDLMQIGNNLDSKGYGIGLPPGSIYRESFSKTILQLQTEQKLDTLKRDWWKNDTADCDSKRKKPSSNSALGVDKVAGSFVMLLIGMVASMLISLLEFVCHSRKRSKSTCYNINKDIDAQQQTQQRSFGEEIAREFRFATACSSYRSQIAEDATELPPPLIGTGSCITPSSADTTTANDSDNSQRQPKSGLSSLLAYSPCTMPPQLPMQAAPPSSSGAGECDRQFGSCSAQSTVMRSPQLRGSSLTQDPLRSPPPTQSDDDPSLEHVTLNFPPNRLDPTTILNEQRPNSGIPMKARQPCTKPNYYIGGEDNESNNEAFNSPHFDGYAPQQYPYGGTPDTNAAAPPQFRVNSSLDDVGSDVSENEDWRPGFDPVSRIGQYREGPPCSTNQSTVKQINVIRDASENLPLDSEFKKVAC